jgi:hypothetical protein
MIDEFLEWASENLTDEEFAALVRELEEDW